MITSYKTVSFNKFSPKVLFFFQIVFIISIFSICYFDHRHCNLMILITELKEDNSLLTMTNLNFIYLLIYLHVFQVLQEIRKAWYKYALRRRESYVYSRSAFMTTWKKGSNQSHTMSSFIDQERSSELSNSTRLLPKGKNNNDCVSKSFTDLRTDNTEAIRRETCEESNCRFLTVPNHKHRHHSNVDSDVMDLN